MRLLQITIWIILWLLGIGFKASAQAPYLELLVEFDTTNATDTTHSFDFGNGCYPLSNGDFLWSGETENDYASDSTQLRRLVVEKRSKNGTIIKRNYFAYPVDCEQEAAADEWFEINGNPALIIRIYDTIQTMYLYVFNEEGDTLYSRFVNALSLSRSEYFQAMTINRNKQLVFAIKLNGTVADSFYLCATDNTGSLLWLKQSKMFRRYITGMVQTNDGGYMLAGYDLDSSQKDWREGNLVYVGHPQRLWIGKFDSAGNDLWQKSFSGEYYEPRDSLYDLIGPRTVGATFYGIIRLSNNTYLAYGSLNIYPYLCNLTEDGTILWEHKYDSVEMHDIYEEYRSWNYFWLAEEWKGDIYTVSNMSNSIVSKFDLQGNRKWKREYPSMYRTINMKMADDGIVLTGYKLYPDGNTDAWLLKLDSYGCKEAGCHLHDAIEDITKKEVETLHIYPNPANTSISIISKKQVSKIHATNVQGKTITLQVSDNTADIHFLASGIYVLQLYDKENNLLARQKLVKE